MRLVIGSTAKGQSLRVSHSVSAIFPSRSEILGTKQQAMKNTLLFDMLG